MLKSSIQRQVRLSCIARQLSTISSMRAARAGIALPRQIPSQQLARRHVVPGHALFRFYSTESAAAQANRTGEFAPVASATVTRFSELPELGVNKNLVEALTRGMGYENMTEVQSMTINAALKGTDM